MSFRVVFCVCVIVSASFPAPGATWTADPSVGNVDQHNRLYEIARRYADANFDPAANLMGVDTAPRPNKTKHSFRESAYYAYGLLLTADLSDRARAQEILKRIVAVQDTRPDSPTCGVFLWYSDQHWETVQNPDLNAAPFIGVALADIIDLDRRRPCLDPDVRSQVEKAARLAVGEVMRRDVDPGYTNIALLSIAFASAGDKLLTIPGSGAWAQSKLDAVMALADDGEFAEYLSPTYTGVALDGAYLARKFAFSDPFAAKADALIDHLWKQVALSYHAPTYQLGGPYLRAYGDDMLTYAARLKYFLYLGLDGAYPIHDWDKGVDKCGLFLIADVPISARPEFKLPHVPWRQWNAVGSGKTPVRHLSQYRDGNFILGTVAFQDEWKQKRNLVAFWRSDAPAPDGFRVGFCIDESNEAIQEAMPGFPGEKVNFYSQQVKDAALVSLVASTNVPLKAVSTLVFDNGAAVADGKEALPLRIQDGAYTAYLYPVSIGTANFETQANAPHNTFRVTRPWSSADLVGSLHVLSYLIIFRPSDQPAPAVSDLALKADAIGVSASAKVDGADLSLLFKN